ncbi:MAG: NfeD family protein [Betaproteobacteria bacterium HGW-Betaproteobacteria-1]|nr:MAG: NfeD family protein [Betaproteobacteria bacterium HGW-Betaproteobacteria-1]
MEPIWLWGILGLMLVAMEMMNETFYILWFGIAALIVSVCLYFFPELHAGWQFLIFAIFSLGSLAIWKIYYRKSPDLDLKVGQSQGDEVGRIGTIVEAVNRKQNGRIQFAQGVMGSKEWTAISEEELEVGSEAEITAVVGNAMTVKRHIPSH